MERPPAMRRSPTSSRSYGSETIGDGKVTLVCEGYNSSKSSCKRAMVMARAPAARAMEGTIAMDGGESLGGERSNRESFGSKIVK